MVEYIMVYDLHTIRKSRFLRKILLLVHAREGPIVIYGNYDIMV